MTREGYRKLAAEFRAKARNEQSPAYREELEDLARCYDSAADDLSRATREHRKDGRLVTA